MKNLMLLITSLFISVSTFAQVEIGKVDWYGMYVADLVYYSDNSLTLSYRDCKYQHIEAFKSIDLDSTGLKILYKTMLHQLTGTEPIVLKLGDNLVSVNNFKRKKSIKITILNERTDITSFFVLRKKDIDKLFGRS